MKITKQFENDLFEFLCDNGLVLTSADNSKSIEAGRGEKDWQVVEYNQISEKEYGTLSGALREISR